MASDNHIYRRLQKHLDGHPVGFPATPGGAEIRILRHIFTPDEAAVAACLSHSPEAPEHIFPRVRHLVSTPEALMAVLTGMLKKGGIELKIVAGRRHYCTAPLVVGMYEFQNRRLTPSFLNDFNEYTKNYRFGLSFLSTRPPQMRTIPVGKSIRPEHRALPFDDIAALMETAAPPFVVLPCICRKKKEMEGQRCRVTQREDTCLAMGSLAEQGIIAEMGRAVSRREALDILTDNQKEGLVLQPANTRKVDFICSCCGCCCGMLSLQQQLPRPLEFWAASYQAHIDPRACKKCGTCEGWCQVKAIHTNAETQIAVVDHVRCIGCGLCVTHCPADAIALVKRDHVTTPPEDREALHHEIDANRNGRLGQIKLAGKLILDVIRSGRADRLK